MDLRVEALDSLTRYTFFTILYANRLSFASCLDVTQYEVILVIFHVSSNVIRISIITLPHTPLSSIFRFPCCTIVMAKLRRQINGRINMSALHRST